MRKFKSQLRKFLPVVAVALLLGGPAKADSDTIIVRGDQLTDSITSYDKNEFGPINVVIKSWNDPGPVDSPAPLQISFYTKGGGDAIRSSFLHTIFVIDDKKQALDGGAILWPLAQTPVYDWDSADCSLQKMMLINKSGAIYLVLAYRSHKDHTTEITPQSEPAPQVIKLFKLVENEAPYFQKVTERKPDALVCGAPEVYQEMQKFANSTLK